MSEDWFQVQYKMWGAEIKVTINRRSINIGDVTQESDHWRDVNSCTCWLEEKVFEAAGVETLLSNGTVRESRALGQSIGQGCVEVYLILFIPGDHSKHIKQLWHFANCQSYI